MQRNFRYAVADGRYYHPHYLEFLTYGNYDVNMLDDDGRTVLMVAVVGLPASVFMVEALLKNKTLNINIVDNNCRTALYYIRRCTDENYIIHMQICKKLILRGININSQDKRGATALLLRIQAFGGSKEEIELQKILLNSGSDIFLPNKCGDTIYSYVYSGQANRSTRSMISKHWFNLMMSIAEYLLILPKDIRDYIREFDTL